MDEGSNGAGGSGGASDSIAYGGVMLALFGNPRSLLRYPLPLSDNGLPPCRHLVRTIGVPHFDQGSLPVCTAVAATTLVSLAYASLDRDHPDPAVAFTYLAGQELVERREDVSIESQLAGGLPLASCVEAVCLSGVVPRASVPTPDDPEALRQWLKTQNTDVAALGRAHAVLPTDFRPLRLFPSEENLKAALIGAKAVAFSFRIGEIIDRWMRSPALQRGSGYRVPPAADVGPRLATHACVIVGFEDAESAFRVRNSFGRNWGIDGDFWVPYGTMMRPSFSAGEFYAIG